MQPKLGILAGGGLLPSCLVKACQKSGRPFHFIGFKGQFDSSFLAEVPYTSIRLGAGGKTLKSLRDNGVEEIILAGNIHRPSLSELRPDAWGIKFLAKTGAMALGDDGLLSTLLRTLENEEGFRVVGVQEIAPELLAPSGNLGTVVPSEPDKRDIEVATDAARALGAADKGQAAVARGGHVIGLESTAGTDSLLAEIKKQTAHQMEDLRSGVLVKVSKPQQERRVDLPTIGKDTIRHVAEAGLAGIAIEAQGALILERAQVAELADEFGVFVRGIPITDSTNRDS